MDVTAPAHRLSAAVSAASRLLPARAGLGLSLQADAAGLTVAGVAPDLAVSFACPATTHTDGSVVVPAAPLVETLKVLDAELVRVVVEGTRLALRLDNARFALPLLPETGVVPDPPAQVSSVDGAAFASALRIVAGTAAKDDPLPLFTGVRLQGGDRLTLTASDRYRMAVARLPLRTPGSLDVLVPASLLSEAARQASGIVGLHLGPGRFGLSWRDGLVATAVLDAGFLSEESIASGAVDTTVSLEADALAAAVRRVGVYAEDRRVLTLEVGDGQVRLASARQNAGEAEETLKADVGGGRTSPSFQARYLLDALAAFAGERVTLAIQPGMRACVLRSADPGEVEVRYYLMPMLPR